ncbi:DUF4432 family protein [Agrobacterium sp. SOY23]|uniref:DUF4432 family protein n=1 Tax=Agrobacterium sp. SOY23 TaxID=3014555 RepID=UPI0022AEDB20|nr:DUF4432 family protein [Agrobacterium sp. SOY23]MCZ4433199.1 DUF4432 family protein [Agrobacterium sp. SOY23]
MASNGYGDGCAVGKRPLAELRKRTVDLRGAADIRLVQVEDGPGRGQRLFILRNSTGLGLEIAIDRGFDICSATWRGVNIGWNSANNLPWPPNSVDAEDGVGFYRNLDGFIVTCGLDHFGAAGRSNATHFMHKHRKEVFNPLHGRISSQRATISGYGIEWEKDTPVIWAEGLVRQSSVFGENLVLRRRVEVEVFGGTVRIDDIVGNKGFRPTPHAILYHVNFGYPFLDETIKIAGSLEPSQMEMFNSENKAPRDDFIDYFKEIPFAVDTSEVVVELCNEAIGGGLRTQLAFDRNSLPDFGVWRAFQSGVYALAFEPMRRASKETELLPGERASYWLRLTLMS